MEIHAAANAFPMMDGNRFEELLQDISDHGLIESITVFDGQILDGRNRFKACEHLGIEPRYTSYDGDPWQYAWSKNGQRRDLIAEQRYLIWKFCNENSAVFQAEKKRITEEANRKRSAATKEQPRSDDGTKLAEKQVTAQSVPLPAEDKHPERESKAKASHTNKGATQRGDYLAKERPDLAEQVREGTMRPAEAHRRMKKDAVASGIEDLPTDTYRVIYADPPWSYNDSQAVKGDYGTGTGAANSHYPSMTLTELKALDINALANDDAVLFLWATCPLLVEALELVKAWGFKYKAQFVWNKTKHNMGHYNSVRHELLLVCTKGSCLPDANQLINSVQHIERTKHSAKPEEFRTIIETLYLGKKIELFRRGEAPEGWDVWGNEA